MSALGTIVLGTATYVVRRAGPADVPALVALLADDAIAAARGDEPGHEPGGEAGNADLEPYREAFTRIDADPHQVLVRLDDAHRFYRGLGFEASHWGFKLALEPTSADDAKPVT